MWEALIKLVEKWAYRCEHDWEELDKFAVYRTDLYGKTEKGPYKHKVTYRCRKCCDTKRIVL